MGPCCAGTDKCTTGASPGFATVPKAGHKPASRRVLRRTQSCALPWLCRFLAGLSPASSIGDSALPGFLQRLAERLQRFELFLILLFLLLVLQGVLLRSLRHCFACALEVHDLISCGFEFDKHVSLTSQARRPQ